MKERKKSCGMHKNDKMQKWRFRMTEKCNKLGFLKTINDKNDSKRDKVQWKQACEFNVNYRQHLKK